MFYKPFRSLNHTQRSAILSFSVSLVYEELACLVRQQGVKTKHTHDPKTFCARFLSRCARWRGEIARLAYDPISISGTCESRVV